MNNTSVLLNDFLAIASRRSRAFKSRDRFICFFGGMFILVVVTSIDKAFYDIAVTVDASVAQERPPAAHIFRTG